MATSPPLDPNVHGGEETGNIENEIVLPAIELSERQRLVLEMNKRFVRGPSRVPVSEFNYFSCYRVLPLLILMTYANSMLKHCKARGFT